MSSLIVGSEQVAPTQYLLVPRSCLAVTQALLAGRERLQERPVVKLAGTPFFKRPVGGPVPGLPAELELPPEEP